MCYLRRLLQDSPASFDTTCQGATCTSDFLQELLDRNRASAHHDFTNEAGNYRILINGTFLTRTGDYSLILRGCSGSCLWRDAKLLRDSPKLLVVKAGEADGSKSYAPTLTNPELYLNDGTGWIAGYPAGNLPSFQIQARNPKP
jgi:hypothetical protein